MASRKEHYYRGELNQEYLKKLDEEAILTIRERSIASSLMYPGLLLAIVFATSIQRRYPKEILIFGAIVVLIASARVAIAASWSRFQPSRQKLWRRLFKAGFHLAALTWGIFAALTIVYFELGWVSFFVLLVTVAIASAKVPILAPNFNLLRTHLIYIFIPSLAANVLFVGGLKGSALAVFFGAFFVLLYVQGRLQSWEYWAAIRDSARLQAMIDALPGTLSWVTSELRYLGVNKQLSETWHLSNEEFPGKKIGFADPHTEMLDFANRLFGGEPDQYSRELNLRHGYYYVVGQKYNKGTEAVIIGLDITDYKKTVLELEAQRLQGKYTARLASLGEISNSLADELDSSLVSANNDIKDVKAKLREKEPRVAEALEKIDRVDDLVARIERLMLVFHRFAFNDSREAMRKVYVKDLIDDLASLCSERFRQNGVQLQVGDFLPDLELECQETQLLEVLLNLLNNAFDAVQAMQPSAWVRIEAQEAGDAVAIAVTDSGSGIPPEVAARMFDPLFTTKPAGKSTGVGLKVSREIVERHGGTITLDASSRNTRFVVRLPAKAGGVRTSVGGKIDQGEVGTAF